MNEQQIASAVDRIEILLVETENVIGDIIKKVIEEDIADGTGAYTSRKRIQKAFHVKHGKGMAAWRKERTGISDQKYKSMDVERRLKDRFAVAKKLMANTQFTQATIGKLASITPGQIRTYLGREGLGTGKTFRKEHVSGVNVYLDRPATRKRTHVNGGMRLKLTNSGISRAGHALKNDLVNKAVLSVSITGLSFMVSRIVGAEILEERLHVKETLLIKTGFLTGTGDTITSSSSVRVPISLPHGDHTNIVASYDLCDNTLTLEADGNNVLRNISFTMLVTETDL